MEWRVASGSIALLWATACGGVAQQSSEHIVETAGTSSLAPGGAVAGALGSAGAGNGGANSIHGGSGGSLDIELPSAGSAAAIPGIPEGNTCRLAPSSCNAVDQFIELEDGTRLSYPLDTSCGQCSFKCEVCDELTCSLWAKAVTSCIEFSLNLAACAGPGSQTPCLDSTSDQPYYVDAAGKRWALVSLTGSETQLPAPVADGPIVVDLELTIGDGVTIRTLAAKAHVCASFYAILVPC